MRACEPKDSPDAKLRRVPLAPCVVWNGFRTEWMPRLVFLAVAAGAFQLWRGYLGVPAALT